MARTTWGPLSTDEQNSIEFAPVGEPGVLAPGTAGGLLKRNADGTMGNSILSESGSVLTLLGRLAINGGTVTASTPVLDLSQTWNNGAVAFYGIKVNITDSASSSVSEFAEFQVGGVQKIGLYKSGSAVFQGNVTAFAGSLTLGNTVVLQESANILALRNSTNAQTFQVYGTADAGLLNYRRIRTTMTTGGAATIAAEGLGTGGSANTLALVSNGSTFLTGSGSGTFLGGTLFFGGQSRLSSTVDGTLLLQNQAGTDADIFLKFGVNTSAAAGIKRVGTELRARLNDDSAYAFFTGKLRTDTNYRDGTFTATGYLTIYDLAGTAYRVPCAV